jgi:hypothetical protein
MLRFVTRARLAQIIADAREQGRKEALAEYKQLAQVVKTAEPAQPIKFQPLSIKFTRKPRKKYTFVKNDQPGVRMANDMKAVCQYITLHMGDKTCREIAKGISKVHGDYLRGTNHAIKVTANIVNDIINGKLVPSWNDGNWAFNKTRNPATSSTKQGR